MTTPDDHHTGIPTRHVRIAAVAGGVVLVVGIAIAIGTASGKRPAPAAARSTSATPSASTPAAAPPISSAPPSASPPVAPSVRWHGTVTLDGPDAHRDLDSVPSRADSDDGDVDGSTFETTLKARDGAQLDVVRGSPGYGRCRDAVTANGTDLTRSLHAGDVVCVLTSQGRVARLRVRSAAIDFPAAVIRAEVTVWDPPVPR